MTQSDVAHSKVAIIWPRFPINPEETAMTNDRSFQPRADGSKSEMTEEQLSIVSGGNFRNRATPAPTLI